MVVGAVRCLALAEQGVIMIVLGRFYILSRCRILSPLHLLIGGMLWRT